MTDDAQRLSETGEVARPAETGHATAAITGTSQVAPSLAQSPFQIAVKTL
jgi:hypothetical protein